jgi:transposase InsO family protein
MEVGRNRHGFCNRTAPDPKRERLYLGDNRPSYQGSPFHPSENYLRRSHPCPNISVRLHGIPRKIVSDRGTQFTSKFWMSLQQAMGTKLDFSTAYDPQSDGQTERVNKVLEDLLRACVLTFDKNWESSLPYEEFSYNNNYQASIKMSSFEALYGRKCQTPLLWSNVGEKTLEGPAFVK